MGIFDRDEERLLSLQSDIGIDHCLLKVMDVTDPKSVADTMEAFAEATGGRMDVLFNNAGVLQMGPNEQVPLKAQQEIVDVNLKGVLNCIHYALPCLKNTPGSRIINMSSASAFYGIPELAVYSATKHALSALTEALDLELEPYALTICDIQPPYVQTPMILAAEKKAFSVNKMGIKLTPGQIAATVWKAAHHTKLHWKLGGPAIYLLLFLFWALPFSKRGLVKFLPACDGSGLEFDPILTKTHFAVHYNSLDQGQGEIKYLSSDHDFVYELECVNPVALLYGNIDIDASTERIGTVPAKDFLPYAFSKIDDWRLLGNLK